jgi:hypothetical protein
MVSETKHAGMWWRHCEVPVLEQWCNAYKGSYVCADSTSRTKTKVDCTKKSHVVVSWSQGHYSIELVDAVSEANEKDVYDRPHRFTHWYVSNNCSSNTNIHSSNPKAHFSQNTCYITLHGSRVSQNCCRMWNKSYNYNNTYTVQLKKLHGF